MLPEPLRLLISAYAIGDLSPRRRAAAMRLLRHSAEARALLRVLKYNRRKLRALPRPALPVNFAAKVVASLPEQPPIIQTIPAAAVGHSRVPSAMRWTIAAAAMVMVAVGAYWAGSLPRERAAPGRFTAERARPEPQQKEVAQAPIPDPDPDENIVPPANSIKTPAPEDRVPAPKKNSAVAKAPPVNRPAPLGSTSQPPSNLIAVSPPRLLTIALRDLEGQDGRAKLEQEFAKSDTHHIDLFCRDGTRAFERLQAAVKARGIKMVVDNFAQTIAQETQKRKLRPQFLIYCDDLKAAEWCQLLQSLAAADKKPGENLFDKAVVVPCDLTDQRELIAITGFDLTQPDARRSASGGTAKKEAKEALAAVIAPARTPPKSKEVLQFLDAHRDRAPGDVSVFLVLRLVGS